MPSHGNFVLFELGEGRVQKADNYLQSRGIVIRQVGGYGLPGWLRATVGDANQTGALIEALGDFMRGE